MQRTLEPELLDELSPDDPRAIHSRRDLRVVNAWMRNLPHVERRIARLRTAPRTVVELGTGDGTFMLKLARRLAARGIPPVALWLVDMQPVVSDETQRGFEQLGWTVRIVRDDVRNWVQNPEPGACDLVCANLFLHHFSDADLRAFFARMAVISGAFISCDPRRWRVALEACRLLWLLGCNDVTRHDAAISIRAGFRDRELSVLWPKESGFNLSEEPAGYASHLFCAERAAGSSH